MSAILWGIAAGGLCAIPTLVALHEGSHATAGLSFGRALVLGLAPFLILQALLVAVAVVSRSHAAAFGTAAVLVYLACVAVASVAAWRKLR